MTTETSLAELGFSPELAQAFASHADRGLLPGRVAVQQRGSFTLLTAAGDVRARLGWRLDNDTDAGERPAVGDWVVFAGRPADGLVTIRAVLPRRSAIKRKAVAGRGAPQVIAANVDWVFIVTSLNGELNPRRLERYLATVHQGGAQPVILLTKADLPGDHAAAQAAVEAIANGAPVHAVSALSGDGLDAVARYLLPGQTVAVIGSSGVGKSTLVNRLAGAERLATAAIGANDKGRHTTTHRELLRLAGGAILLDTPGMRELGLYDAAAGLETTFADLEALACQCRFRNCAHESEPDCALLAAVEDGTLDHKRWKSYVKLTREATGKRRRGWQQEVGR